MRTSYIMVFRYDCVKINTCTISYDTCILNSNDIVSFAKNTRFPEVMMGNGY